MKVCDNKTPQRHIGATAYVLYHSSLTFTISFSHSHCHFLSISLKLDPSGSAFFCLSHLAVIFTRLSHQLLLLQPAHTRNTHTCTCLFCLVFFLCCDFVTDCQMHLHSPPWSVITLPTALGLLALGLHTCT